FNVTESRQIIIDLKNVNAIDRVIRAFDTSEFSGSIVFVSAYKKPDSPDDLRVALQLRDNVRSIIERDENKLLLNVENRFGAFSKVDIKNNEDQNTAKKKTKRINTPHSDSVEDILHNITLSGRKKYIGKKITLNIKDVKIEDVLAMIADVSGFNIIISKQVKALPSMTLNLNNVPWDQALDTIISLNKLVAKKNGVILTLSTFKEEADNKKLELDNKKISQSEEAQITQIFPLSYAKIEDIEKMLGKYVTQGRGTVLVDQRTNSLIIRDTHSVIDKIKKIVDVLDSQTPQVLIESKIVEVTERYSKTLGLQNGLGFGYDPLGQVTSRARTPLGTATSLDMDGGPGFAFNSAPNLERNLMGLTVTRFGRLTNLDFRLQLMENESQGKVISSPKVITQNKKKALITSQDTTSYVVTTNNGTNTTTGYQQSTATLSLEVTPQVTNEGSIGLNIVLSKDQFANRVGNAPPDKQSRSLTTNVLVKNGSTIVLGGIYSFEKNESHSGIPFLKDIPLLGWLFRTPYNPDIKKSEMIIFLTPRVINQEEAGLVEKS
ncbi:MAG: type IV pilus secretin PilQ, partial [Halobacteriovoraceae bacterium]|nr:type IV pilus secretin PilQ [Halobacteriovoraceae bacterium]